MDMQIRDSRVGLSSLERIGLGAGLFTAGGLMIYFLLAKYFHFIQIIQLRYLNFFILLAGILIAINTYRKRNNNHVEYLEGFFLGMFTTAITSIVFAVFVGVYLSFHQDFMNYIKTVAIMGDYLTPSAVALIISIEGGISGLIITFVSLQYYRKFEVWHSG